jgi:rhodanese-related sulfurtransferase
MKRRSLSRLSWQQKLALTAAALGALAVFGEPYGGGRVEISTRELAAIVQGEIDHVSPAELAQWIVAGRTDYRLLDLRDAGAFAEYHIPGAENVALTALEEYPLWRNERIVLYSDGGLHAAQAWFLLRAKGYSGAAILAAGLDGWKDEVLFPLLDGAEVGGEQAARRQALAAHFGGTPRSGGAAAGATAAPALPRVEPPAAAVAAAPRKKKKEGC